MWQLAPKAIDALKPLRPPITLHDAAQRARCQDSAPPSEADHGTYMQNDRDATIGNHVRQRGVMMYCQSLVLDSAVINKLLCMVIYTLVIPILGRCYRPSAGALTR